MKEVNFENIDNHIQYSSIEGAIEAHAKTYSFNIDSELFPQLTEEQQKLWRKEIEQACISGGDAGISLTRDLRYKENNVIDKECIMRELLRLLDQWHLCNSTEAKYRCEAYSELLEWINKL